MKTTLKILAVAAAALVSNCAVMVQPPVDYTGTGDNTTYEPTYYVNSYLPLSTSVKALIAPSVTGYATPALASYDEYLYPSDAAYDPNNLPCFVKTDLNGDGSNDYALLFSYEEWDDYNWYLTTKLIVALSTPDGLTLATDLTLGTVTADESVPVEEYWGLTMVPAGTHTLETWHNGVKVTESITLENDAIYLASLDPAEEGLFYADGGSMYETEWFTGSLGKKKVSTAASDDTTKRVIPFAKNTENRKRAIQ